MKYYVVDAFAERLFEGNPAGVCIMDEWINNEVMQNIAMENHLSETAFAVKEGERYKLRWFTPGAEIKLCGHATMATSFVIMNIIEKGLESIEFDTMSGVVSVRRVGELYELNLPTEQLRKIDVTDKMIDALGEVPTEAYLSGDLMFVLQSEDVVRKASPDFRKLQQLAEGQGVYITAKGESVDFVSRAFFPKLKINEDAVCGSMHCTLVPYWSAMLGKKEMVARQVSKRGGTVYCKDEGDRVKVAGQAQLYLEGTIKVKN